METVEIMIKEVPTSTYSSYHPNSVSTLPLHEHIFIQTFNC